MNKRMKRNELNRDKKREWREREMMKLVVCSDFCQWKIVCFTWAGQIQYFKVEVITRNENNLRVRDGFSWKGEKMKTIWAGEMVSSANVVQRFVPLACRSVCRSNERQRIDQFGFSLSALSLPGCSTSVSEKRGSFLSSLSLIFLFPVNSYFSLFSNLSFLPLPLSFPFSCVFQTKPVYKGARGLSDLSSQTLERRG